MTNRDADLIESLLDDAAEGRLSDALDRALKIIADRGEEIAALRARLGDRDTRTPAQREVAGYIGEVPEGMDASAYLAWMNVD